MHGRVSCIACIADNETYYVSTVPKNRARLIIKNPSKVAQEKYYALVRDSILGQGHSQEDAEATIASMIEEEARYDITAHMRERPARVRVLYQSAIKPKKSRLWSFLCYVNYYGCGMSIDDFHKMICDIVMQNVMQKYIDMQNCDECLEAYKMTSQMEQWFSIWRFKNIPMFFVAEPGAYADPKVRW